MKEDLALMFVLGTEEGLEFIAGLLKEAWVGSPVPEDPGAFSVHNFGIMLLERVWEADPLAGQAIMARVMRQPAAQAEYPLE